MTQPRLTNAVEIEARAMREQATAMRTLGFALHRAIMAADWKAAAEVRCELARMALGFDSVAEMLEHATPR